jgi:phospholipid/cholesterol/gamma-HCH transport system substrate-binding protein
MASDENYNRGEILVGSLVSIGILYLVYVGIGLGNWHVLGADTYVVYADFVSASGLNVGDPVEIAGVEIGNVESISLVYFQARVDLRIKDSVTIHEDSIATIKTKGLIGDRLLSVEPVTSVKSLEPGDEIKKTASPQSLQELVGELVAGDLVPDQ